MPCKQACCADTTFTGFTRSLAPGIRARPGSRLWLNNCVFREITLIPPDPGLQLPPEKRVSIQATAIAAENNVELVLVVCLCLMLLINHDPPNPTISVALHPILCSLHNSMRYLKKEADVGLFDRMRTEAPQCVVDRFAGLYWPLPCKPALYRPRL